MQVRKNESTNKNKTRFCLDNNEAKCHCFLFLFYILLLANHVYHNCHIFLLVNCHCHKKGKKKKKEKRKPLLYLVAEEATRPIRSAFHISKSLFCIKAFLFSLPLCLKPSFYYLHYPICIPNFGIATHSLEFPFLFFPNFAIFGPPLFRFFE